MADRAQGTAEQAGRRQRACGAAVMEASYPGRLGTRDSGGQGAESSDERGRSVGVRGAERVQADAVGVRPHEQVDKHRSGATTESLSSNGTASRQVFNVA